MIKDEQQRRWGGAKEAKRVIINQFSSGKWIFICKVKSGWFFYLISFLVFIICTEQKQIVWCIKK